jgi:response regulator of citrate/malate metabolism
MKILYIEDEFYITELVKTYIINDEVVIARKLREAIELLNNKSFDFLIVDLYLEDSDPNETLSLLDNYNIPKIIVTGDDDEKLIERALLLNNPPVDYVLKQDYPGIHLIRKILFNIEKIRKENNKILKEKFLSFDGDTFNQIQFHISKSLPCGQLIAH